MSRRTKLSKSWAKKARGTYKTKSWKQELPSFYTTKLTQSSGGTTYEQLTPTPAFKSTFRPSLNSDLIAYINRFFGGLL